MTFKASITEAQCDQLIRHVGAFRIAASLLEEKIDREGIRPVVETDITKKTVRIVPESTGSLTTCMPMLAACNFNFGVALELGLKCLFALHGGNVVRAHKLAQIYFKLPETVKEHLNTAFLKHRGPVGITWLEIVIDRRESPDPRESRKKPLPQTLREVLVYFDNQFKLASKRYVWEDAVFGRLSGYIHDSRGFLMFIKEIEDLIVKTAKNCVFKPNP